MFKVWSFFKTLMLSAIVVAVSSTTVGVGTASAAAYYTASHAVGLSFTGGPGHAGPVWAGTWNNGGKGFCLDFGLRTPDRSSTAVVTGLIPGMNAEESKSAKFIANKYAATTSDQTAANAGFAIWRLQHDTAFNTWYAWARSANVVTAARNAAVDAILADAAQYAPYNMTMTATAAYVGVTASGTVKVLGSNGRMAVGRAVTITATNAKVLTVNGVAGNKGLTRSTGLVYTYQPTNSLNVTFKASLVAPSSSKAGISVSSSGHQRTLSGGYSETAAASISFLKTVGKPTITSVCNTDCKGVSTVTFSYANPAAQAVKWPEKIGSSVIATLNVKAHSSASITVKVADGKIIAPQSYCYTGSILGGPCTTATVVVPGSYEIVCPAWAQATLTIECTCKNIQSSVTLTSPKDSPRYYRGFISINRAASQQADLVNGTPASINIGSVGKGTNVAVSFLAYRDAARTIPLGTPITLQDITVN